MDPQKGVDIAVEALKLIKDVPWQAILLGTGDPGLESACKDLVELLPGKARAVMQFDSKLSRRLYAAADMLMMPSRYEPCGISQMIAMRYGCIPVASATGGLVDTILDDENDEKATGFLSPEANASSFSRTLLRAINTYQDRDRWQQLIISAMTQDFSWDRSAQQYLERYISLAHM
jgi:starch synthase